MHTRTLALAMITALFGTPAALSEESAAMTQCVALSNEDKLAEAEPFCMQAAAEAPPDQGTLLKGDFASRKGDLKSAERFYSEILGAADLAKPSDVQLAALAGRALVLFNLQDGRDASNDVVSYLKHRPDDLEMLKLGYHATVWNDRREEFANRLVALKPAEMEFHLMRVHALMQSGKGKEAVEAADAAVKLDPKSNPALSWRGFAYQESGDFEKAERDHAAVARRLPKEPDPRANRAKVLLHLQRYADAIEAASEALALKADHFSALQIRAHARLRMGDGEGALADIQAAKKAAPGPFASDVELDAPYVIDAHKAMTRESLARMESDRQVIVAAFLSHLQGKCGYYTVPTNEDNVNLNAYRDCLLAWSRVKPGETLAPDMPASVLETAERFYDYSDYLVTADELRCSRMPKKSRCVDDSTYTRAETAFAGMDNPKHLVGNAEWDRLNAEVQAYNSRLGRQEALGKTASFLQAVADALAGQ